MTDVVVVDAGITGAATAWELADTGLDVMLLDRYAPDVMGRGWTLVGVRQSGRHSAELPLAQAAVANWAILDEMLERATLRDLAPAVSRDVLGAYWYLTDGQPDPYTVMQAFVDAAVRAGARTRFGDSVISVEVIDGRVTSMLGNRLLPPLGLYAPAPTRAVTLHG